MLGRIAESASLGHSFRHNALMKWSTKKRPTTKSSLPPPKRQRKPKQNPGLMSSKPGQLLIGTER